MRSKLFAFGEPSAVTGRTWAIKMGPSALHARACECLMYRKDTRITGVKLADSSIAIDPPASLFGVVSDVLERARKPGHPLSLSRALELLERLTIHLSFRIILPGPGQPQAANIAASPHAGVGGEVRVDRAWARDEDLRISGLVPPGESFADQWEEWCFRSGRSLLELLEEDEFVKGQLKILMKGGVPLWGTLRGRAGTSGRLSLGRWSCELPRLWNTECDPFWAASQWAEFLLAKRHGTNTRAVKERLRDARVERQIGDVWAAYEGWLVDHAEAIREVETLLGVRITGPFGSPRCHENAVQNSDKGKSVA